MAITVDITEESNSFWIHCCRLDLAANKSKGLDGILRAYYWELGTRHWELGTRNLNRKWRSIAGSGADGPAQYTRMSVGTNPPLAKTRLLEAN